jgi:hypothetical protein
VSVVFVIVKVSTTKNRKQEKMVHSIVSPQGSYFAEDGSYGSAGQLAIVDTADWDDNDWQLIEEASDAERVYVARQIGERRRQERKKI